MSDQAQRRGELIKLLEDALTLSEDLYDAATGFLIGVRSMNRGRSNSSQSPEGNLDVCSAAMQFTPQR